MNENKEIWRPVVGYEGLYEVSSEGRFKCCTKTVYCGIGNKVARVFPEKISDLKPTKSGYVRTTIQGKKPVQIHILVAEAFPEICGERFEGAEIDHINGCKWDNRASNLRFVSHKTNIENPITKKKFIESHRTKEYRISRGKPIIQYDAEDMYPIAEWNSTRECGRFTGIRESDITAVLNNRQKTTKGFIFTYKK